MDCYRKIDVERTRPMESPLYNMELTDLEIDDAKAVIRGTEEEEDDFDLVPDEEFDLADAVPAEEDDFDLNFDDGDDDFDDDEPTDEDFEASLKDFE